jgi:hypothetical protein
MLAHIVGRTLQASQRRNVIKRIKLVLLYIIAHAEKSIVTKPFRAVRLLADWECSGLNLCA